MAPQDNYNNAAMESLMGGDGSDPSSNPSSASISAPAPPPGLQISKVPGGFQVSTIVPTIDEAHAISQRFLGPEQNGDPQGQDTFSNPSSDEGDEGGEADQPASDEAPADGPTDDESESSAPPAKSAPPRKGAARQ